jgi:hypothetical protein
MTKFISQQNLVAALIARGDAERAAQLAAEARVKVLREALRWASPDRFCAS